jgi:nucleolar protein 12
MSLLQSIFGSKKATSAPAISSDLFETTITVPEPKPYITHSTKKKRKAPPAAAAAVETNKDESVNETTEGVDISAKEQNEAVNDKTTDDAADDDEERTIFVGNLPVSITRKSLAALFSNCDSKVVSTRIRSVATTGVKLPATSAGNQKLVKKVCTHVPGKIDATIKDNLHAYVVFADASSVAIAIAKHNNTLLNGHYIRVDTASPTIDPKRCVFVGNLPYASQEESLRQHFVTTMNNCRPDDILGVRVVRDARRRVARRQEAHPGSDQRHGHRA